MENPYRDDVSVFGVLFTHAIIAWNTAEDSARTILRGLSGDNPGAAAAIIHLGNRALPQAILAVTEEMIAKAEQQELAEHINHFVDGFTILRAYRNHYVHSLRGMGKTPKTEDGFHGTIMAAEANNRFSWVQDRVTIPKLSEFSKNVRTLSVYGHEISGAMGKWNALLQMVEEPKPLSSLDKPTWPDVLVKPRRYLVERKRQPRSSRA